MLDASSRWRAAVVAGVALAATAPGFFTGPIPQSPAYHRFADRRAWLGIPNFADVSSNLLFLLVGTGGITVLIHAARHRRRQAIAPSPELRAYLVFFCGVTLTCFGSAYYHLAPTTGRLVWDRLPMSLGFMGLLSATLAERVSPRVGQLLLGPLVLVGAFTVAFWAWTESVGRGDLRSYYAVQYVSLLLIVTMVILFPSPHGGSADILASVAIYAVAKVCEAKDGSLLNALGVSGHTLKHVTAAVSIWVIARMLARRHRIPLTGGGQAGALVEPRPAK
jgi:hypothetical protein